jgi:hypothetical protein
VPGSTLATSEAGSAWNPKDLTGGGEAEQGGQGGRRGAEPNGTQGLAIPNREQSFALGKHENFSGLQIN